MDVKLTSSPPQAQPQPHELGAELLPRLRMADLDGITMYTCEEPVIPGRQRIQLTVRLGEVEGVVTGLSCALRAGTEPLFDGPVPLRGRTPHARAFELLDLFASYGGLYLYGVLREDQIISDYRRSDPPVRVDEEPGRFEQGRSVSGAEHPPWVYFESTQRGYALTVSPSGKRVGQKMIIVVGKHHGSGERILADVQRTIALLAAGEEPACVAAVLGLIRNFGATLRFEHVASSQVPMLREVRRRLLARGLPAGVSTQDAISTEPRWQSVLPELLLGREYAVVHVPTFSDMTPCTMRLWFDRSGGGVIEVLNRRKLSQPQSVQGIQLRFWVGEDAVPQRTEGIVSEAALRFVQDPADGVKFLSRHFALAGAFSNPGDGFANGAPLVAWLTLTRWYDAIAAFGERGGHRCETFTLNPKPIEQELRFSPRFGMAFGVTAGPDGERVLTLHRKSLTGRVQEERLPLLRMLNAEDRESIVREFMGIGWRSFFTPFENLSFVRLVRSLAGAGLDS